MFLTNANIVHRVARRYVNSRFSIDYRDHDIFWTIPPQFPGISDDIAVQCSQGATVATQDVEEAIAKTRGIEPGSCRFSETHANDRVNRVRFKLKDNNGKLLGGTVTVNIVSREDQLSAFSLIELDDETHVTEVT